jgi:hypothetical protein
LRQHPTDDREVFGLLPALREGERKDLQGRPVIIFDAILVLDIDRVVAA